MHILTHSIIINVTKFLVITVINDYKVRDEERDGDGERERETENNDDDKSKRRIGMHRNAQTVVVEGVLRLIE